jgi:hypothetical protein
LRCGKRQRWYKFQLTIHWTQMNYYIQRQLSEYGPYSLADLQRYVAQGNISLADMARSEAMTEWVPVSQIIGNIPVPVAAAPNPGGTVYGGSMVYSAPAAVALPVSPYPPPPDFHWALVLLINFFCGFFSLVWLLVEAAWVRKVKPDSNALFFLIGAYCAPVAGILIAAVSQGNGQTWGPPLFALLLLAALVGLYVGIFQMREAIEDHYNQNEPINLRLSGVMTFFFSVYYFQYHFTRINNWKRTGYLQPQ